jgi:hypothetical protein
MSVIDSNSKYGVFKKQDLQMTELTKNTLNDFINKISQIQELYIVVNQKKILMQKIYYNLARELKNYVKIKCVFLDDLKPGALTNYQSKHFFEPKGILVILTKNHNKKQLRLINEINKTNSKLVLWALNTSLYIKDNISLELNSIKALYWALYFLKSMRYLETYKQFSKQYQLTKEKLDFDILNDF